MLSGSPGTKLLDQFAACRTMNYAQATEKCYTAWVVDYLHFHRQLVGQWVHPGHLRESEAELLLTHLATDHRLATSSQSQALCALVFLYREVLGQFAHPLRGNVVPFHREQFVRGGNVGRPTHHSRFGVEQRTNGFDAGTADRSSHVVRS